MSWTLKEKKCLLDTLQKEGCKMTVLQKKLPKKTAQEIKAFCRKYEQLAKNRLEKKENPNIGTWIEIFRNISNAKTGHLDDISARVLRYLGVFRSNDNTKHDDPVIKKCYIWLAQAAQGREPDPIDDCSSCILEQCLMHLMKATKVPNKEAEQYICSMESIPVQGLFIENPSINPLDMSAEYLEIKESEKKDPFDDSYVEK